MQGLQAHLGGANQLLQTYTMNNFKGYAATLEPKLVAMVQTMDEDIEYIEADKMVHAYACSQQSNAEWVRLAVLCLLIEQGLDRISQVEIHLDGNYRYDADAGEGVDAYIVDTGILTTHQEFEGRAIFGANYAGGSNADCNGHGTHVAGTVGGALYGVAKKATLIAVKVLNCQGSGTNSGVISGINYVATSYASRKRPSVAKYICQRSFTYIYSMSLGGSKSTALNDAVAGVVSDGVSFVVAAGNENQDACNTSPASTSSAISVGATTIENDVCPLFIFITKLQAGTNEDTRASFSNFGTCVSIFAPGELIKSAWIGSNTATLTISGTSMASPHVAGAVALYLSQNPSSTPSQIKSHFVNNSLHNVINLDCSSTACSKSPNKFLHTLCN